MRRKPVTAEVYRAGSGTTECSAKNLSQILKHTEWWSRWRTAPLGADCVRRPFYNFPSFHILVDVSSGLTLESLSAY